MSNLSLKSQAFGSVTKARRKELVEWMYSEESLPPHLYEALEELYSEHLPKVGSKAHLKRLTEGGWDWLQTAVAGRDDIRTALRAIFYDHSRASFVATNGHRLHIIDADAVSVPEDLKAGYWGPDQKFLCDEMGYATVPGGVQVGGAFPKWGRILASATGHTTIHLSEVEVVPSGVTKKARTVDLIMPNCVIRVNEKYWTEMTAPMSEKAVVGYKDDQTLVVVTESPRTALIMPIRK